MSSRARLLLHPNPTLGEENHPLKEENLKKEIFKFKYERRPVKITVREQGSGGVTDRYAGLSNVFVLEGELLIPSSEAYEPKTLFCFMHPAASMAMLPYPISLARAGLHVLMCQSRYTNDSALVMEKCIKDLATYISYAKTKLGYEKIVLVGWSGGGSLSVFYQSQATLPSTQRVTFPIDLSNVELPKANALIVIAAHASRARILTECLDPSIYMFRRGDNVEMDAKLQHLNLYGPKAPQPPYTTSYLQEFRKEQIARSLRITKWCRKQVKNGNPGACFLLDGTMADPRWLDFTCDANDRPDERICYLGDPEVANDMPTGLARFSSALSWLSQFSYHDTNADAVRHMKNINDISVVVIENGADNGCPVPHPTDVFNACASNDKSYKRINGARHYYDGQTDKLLESVQFVLNWLRERDLINIAPSSSSSSHHVHEHEKIKQFRENYDGSNSMKITGINHLALVSSDMERTCKFYGEVLGLRLTKTLDVGTDGSQHFFFDLAPPRDNNSNNISLQTSLAFFWFPDAKPRNPTVSSPSIYNMKNGLGFQTAMGSMNHVAFNVHKKDILEYRKRIRKSGMSPYVSPMLYHADGVEGGFVFDAKDDRISWRSFYFFGPDGEYLELTSQEKEYGKDVAENNVIHLPRHALWR